MLCLTKFMCETLDEIHTEQLAAVIARMKKQKAQTEKPLTISR